MDKISRNKTCGIFLTLLLIVCSVPVTLPWKIPKFCLKEKI